MTGDNFSAVVERLAQASSLTVLCEFDGTLADCAAHPSSVRPAVGAIEAMAELGSCVRTTTGVISHRSSRNLQRICRARLGHVADRIPFFGSGGTESVPHGAVAPTAEQERARWLLSQGALWIAGTYPGVIVEQTRHGVALYLRKLSAVDLQHLVEGMRALMSRLPTRVHWHVRDFVMEVSVLPLGHHRSIAVLREPLATTVLYAGGDERAHGALEAADVGVVVGVATIPGAVYLKSPNDFVELLASLARARQTAVGMTTNANG
jgi:trehalose-6-phosphatase